MSTDDQDTASRTPDEPERYRPVATERTQWRSPLVRAISLIAVAAIVMAALWSAGAPSGHWFAWLHETDKPPVSASAGPAPAAPPVLRSNSDQPTAEQQSQRLRLVATAPGRNAREGTAQLGVDLTNPQTYAAGALLENGAILREVYADHVLLERDGRTTELYVEGMAASPLAKRKGKTDEALLRVDVGAPTAPKLPPSPPTYTSIVRAAPKFENQTIVGFNVYPGENRGTFAQVGLHPGDLLVSIDGMPLTSTDELNRAMRALSEGRALTATVSRSGKEISVSLEGVRPAEAGPALANASVGERRN